MKTWITAIAITLILIGAVIIGFNALTVTPENFETNLLNGFIGIPPLAIGSIILAVIKK